MSKFRTLFAALALLLGITAYGAPAHATNSASIVIGFSCDNISLYVVNASFGSRYTVSVKSVASGHSNPIDNGYFNYSLNKAWGWDRAAGVGGGNWTLSTYIYSGGGGKFGPAKTIYCGSGGGGGSGSW